MVAELPLWQVVRHEIEEGDKPHHVATSVLRHTNVELPPVPVERIAKELGVEVVREPDLDVAGMLAPTRSSARITVNSSDPLVRQRFTIAHELGHLLLHAIDVDFHFRDYAYGPTNAEIEREANEFAASLLMPLWLVEPIVLYSKRTTKDMAELFEVSSRAMEVQLSKLL